MLTPPVFAALPGEEIDLAEHLRRVSLCSACALRCPGLTDAALWQVTLQVISVAVLGISPEETSYSITWLSADLAVYTIRTAAKRRAVLNLSFNALAGTKTVSAIRYPTCIFLSSTRSVNYVPTPYHGSDASTDMLLSTRILVAMPVLVWQRVSGSSYQY
eukprot:2470676-Rhodomonas_salina.4